MGFFFLFSISTGAQRNGEILIKLSLECNVRFLLRRNGKRTVYLLLILYI